MKVTANPFIYTGTCEGLVYYYNRRLGVMIARKWVRPQESSQNRRIGAVSRHLKTLEISAAYRNDLNTYVALSAFGNGTRKYLNWRNAFLTLMYALSKQYPDVDLATITREQITTASLPCKSVFQAVQAGLLNYLPGCERLTAEM